MTNFLNLGYLLATAEELNSTRTVRKLYISQRSLNNHIPNLRKGSNAVPFDRASSLALTYAGRTLKTRARGLLDLQDETYKEISDIKDFSTRQLSIGVSHTHGRVTLPKILPAYQSQFPDIEPHLAEGNPSQLTSDLLHESTDLMVDLLPFMAENAGTAPTYNEGILIVVPDDIPEEAYPGQVEKAREKLRATSDIWILEHCPFILLKKGNRVHTIADETFEDAQVSPWIVPGTENIETVLALSGKGMGIASYLKMLVSPDPASRPCHNVVLEQNHLSFYSLNYTRARGILGIDYHEDRYMSRAAHELIHVAREWLDYMPKK